MIASFIYVVLKSQLAFVSIPLLDYTPPCLFARDRRIKQNQHEANDHAPTEESSGPPSSPLGFRVVILGRVPQILRV